jgi:hypothetical protein
MAVGNVDGTKDAGIAAESIDLPPLPHMTRFTTMAISGTANVPDVFFRKVCLPFRRRSFEVAILILILSF